MRRPVIWTKRESRLEREQGRETSATMSIYTLLREEGRQEGIEQGVLSGQRGMLRVEAIALLIRSTTATDLAKLGLV